MPTGTSAAFAFYFFGGFASNEDPSELDHLMLTPKKIATTATTATAQTQPSVTKPSMFSPKLKN